MSRSTPRAVVYLALILACLTAAGAKAAVGGLSGGALSSFAHGSPVQTVQSGECWEQNGPDGPGYYPCSDGDGGGPSLSPAIRRHHPQGVVVAHPHASNRTYSGAPSGRVSPSGAVGSSGSRGVGAPASPGLAGGAGVHGPGVATGAHIGAPVSPGLAGGHAPGGAVPHIGSPASPGVAGSGVGAPHISAPVSPNLSGVHALVGAAVPHIGAPASPGLAGGGVHGVGGGGGFGGIGHR
jgi:hypothetical protein